MKDLYARTGLRPYDTDERRLREALKGFTETADAARYVLTHEGRRDIYDRTHATLTDISIVRAALGLNDSEHWREMGDFTRTLSRKRRIRNPAQLMFLAFLLTIFVVVVLTNSPDSNTNRQSREVVAPRRTEARHVTAETLNVRAAPSPDAPIVGQLRRFETVQARPDGIVGQWAEIAFNGEIAYVATEYLALGDGRSAENEACRSAGITRPSSGQILETSGVRGIHVLTVNASASSDAIAKLERPNGETIFAFYVRAGSSATIETIPDGQYRFKYSTGRNFSPTCGRFVDNANAFVDPELNTFGERNLGSLEYTLTEVVSGNFSPTRIDASDF